MLIIHDPELTEELQRIAEMEQRPVEDVLRSMLAHYPVAEQSEVSQSVENDAIRRVRRQSYDKARRYWLSIGDTQKAQLTDTELDKQFGAFDEEGIPRLKSELTSLEPPVGSLAYAAKVIRETGGIRATASLGAEQIDDILDEEFADYLLKRMRGDDAAS